MGTISVDMLQIFRRPAMVETTLDLILCMVPLWVAVMIGVVIGWSWKPRWASLVLLGLRSRPRLVWTAPPGFGARRLWFALTALSAFPVLRKLWYYFKASRIKEEQNSDDESVHEQEVVTLEDLEKLFLLLEERDGGPEWQLMMDRSTPNMTYQAWCRDPEVGPTQYRTKTVYEDVTPELARDFFWDDDFRPKWDDMLPYCKTLEECPHIGIMISHWIRKFPFFCSDREYIIGRRIWEAGRTYYCVTKGIPYPSLPRHNKPKRVDIYYSSWRIKAVESRKGDGQLTACEVILFHHEDVGIPKEIAKFAIRRGMWTHVKKTCHGLSAYQKEQMSGGPLSHCAFMARINTKVPSTYLRDLTSSAETQEAMTSATEAPEAIVQASSNAQKGNRWKWVIVGGVVVLACCLDRGVMCKALIFGAARRIKNFRKKNDKRREELS